MNLCLYDLAREYLVNDDRKEKISESLACIVRFVSQMGICSFNGAR